MAVALRVIRSSFKRRLEPGSSWPRGRPTSCSRVQELSAATACLSDLKGRMAKYGRRRRGHGPAGRIADHRKHRGGARIQLSRLQSCSRRPKPSTLRDQPIGTTLNRLPLDGPVPAPRLTRAAKPSHACLRDGATGQHDLRDLYNLTAAARGHWVLCGTPKRIADERWRNGSFEEAADGSIVLPRTSLARWSTSSTSSCRSFRRAGCFGVIDGRRCGTTSGCARASAHQTRASRRRAHSPDQILRRRAIIAYSLSSPRLQVGASAAECDMNWSFGRSGGLSAGLTSRWLETDGHR